MLNEFTSWLIQLVVAFFNACWDFLLDVITQFVDLFLGAFAALFAAIPVPSWMSSGLNAVYSQLDPAVMYLASQSGVPAALGILGTAYVFRLGRKVVTLFQW